MNGFGVCYVFVDGFVIIIIYKELRLLNDMNEC